MENFVIDRGWILGGLMQQVLSYNLYPSSLPFIT